MKNKQTDRSYLRLCVNNLRPFATVFLACAMLADGVVFAAGSPGDAAAQEKMQKEISEAVKDQIAGNQVIWRQMPQLSSKEEQLAALEELLSVLKYQYAGLEGKNEDYGLSIEKVRAKYSTLIQEAITMDEASGFSPRKPRNLLSPAEVRYVLTAVVSELHDGHTRALAPTQDATTIGIHGASILGKLYVTGLKPKYMVTVYEDKPVQYLDQVIAIDDKPIDEYVKRNLQYINNGSIEARKDEALERILEVPHKLLPPHTVGQTVRVTFRRDGIDFTNEYRWQKIDEIDLTRPATPSETAGKGDRFERDTGELVFGEKGAVRSYFYEGLMNMAENLRKQGKPMRIDNFGDAINQSRANLKLNLIKTYLEQQAQKASASSGAPAAPVDPTARPSTKGVVALVPGNQSASTEPPREISDEDLQMMMDRLAPVERLQAYVIRRPKGNSVAVIRLPSYMPRGDGIKEVFNELMWIQTALYAFQQDPDIGLIVIDQLSNPGGYVIYGEMLLSLFAPKDKPLLGQSAQFVLSEKLFQSYLLDRPMTNSSENMVAKRREFLLSLRRQMDNNQRMSDLRPYSTDSIFGRGGDPSYIMSHGFSTDKKLAWLVDGRSASCGEFAPAVIQDNKRGTIMGEKTMGLGHPLNGHVKDLSLSEMDFRCPYAVSKRPLGKSIEGRGVTSDLTRQVYVRDLKMGFMQYFVDQFGAMAALADGADLDAIQSKLTNSELRLQSNPVKAGDSAAAEAAEKNKVAFANAQALIGEFRKKLAGLPVDIEAASAQWAQAYKQFFAELSVALTDSTLTEGQMSFLDVPLPDQLLKSDDLLNGSFRKDVVLRRLEEMLNKPSLEKKPNTLAFIDSLRKMAAETKGHFSFNLSCRALLGK